MGQEVKNDMCGQFEHGLVEMVKLDEKEPLDPK